MVLMNLFICRNRDAHVDCGPCGVFWPPHTDSNLFLLMAKYYSITFQLFHSIWNDYYWNNYWNNCYSITISIIPFHFNK